MPNRAEHTRQGGIAGCIVACVANVVVQVERKRLNCDYRFNLAELAGTGFIGYGAGYVGGIMPDVLEPADHPGHRDICHSAVAGTLVLVGAKKLNDNPNVSAQVKTLVNTAAAGYLVHLWADGQTPAGIPLITRR
jgi:hypothetical protein